MKLRVTQTFVSRALRYKKKHFLMKYFCTKYLYKEDDTYRLVVRLWFPLYLIILLPITILQIFYCMWDGGLKTLTLESRTVINRKICKNLYPDDYSVCEEEWTRRTT